MSIVFLFGENPDIASAGLGGPAVGKLFKFHDNWLHYRALVEALAREKELYSAGAGDYTKVDGAGRIRPDLWPSSW